MSVLLMFISLIIPAYLLQSFPLFENPLYNHLMKALFIGLIVILGILILRNKIDKGIPKKIGLAKTNTAFKHLLIGMGFIVVPLIITICVSKAFNWTDFSFNINEAIITSILLGFLSTFFTDALSEELIFRGYIFSNLHQHYNLWKSSLITLAVFVIAPIFIISIQNVFNIQGSVPLSGGYIINLLFFGAFMQYLRIIFKSIWVGVGFHLIFVHMNQFMGITNDRLIQFSENYNEKPIQVTLLILLLIILIGLILYPILQKRKQKKLTLLK